MFISLKKAKTILCAEAGFTIAAAAEAINALPSKTFGKRKKVKKADVSKIVADANRPTPAREAAVKIRPFQKRVIEQIRQAASR